MVLCDLEQFHHLNYIMKISVQWYLDFSRILFANVRLISMMMLKIYIYI